MRLDSIKKKSGVVIGGTLAGQSLAEVDLIVYLIEGNNIDGLCLEVSKDGYTKVIEENNYRDKLLRYLIGNNDNKETEELEQLVDSSIPMSSEYRNIGNTKERIESFIDFINNSNIETMNSIGGDD